MVSLLLEMVLVGMTNKVKSYSADDFEKQKKATLERAIKYVEKKDFSPAMLSFLSYVNMRGNESMPPEFLKVRNEFSKDVDVVKFFAVSKATNPIKDQAEAMEIFNELQRKAGRDVAELLVLKANILAVHRKTSEAIKVMQEALQLNPLLVGGWVDLGRLYLQDYQTSEAWKCYQMAKQIYPQHQMLKVVYDMEKKIESTYPEYFAM